MPNTRLAGHALQHEGKPHVPGATSRWVRVYASSSGVALCECGGTSRVLDTDVARKAWHRAHKQDVLGAFDGAPGHG